MAGLSAIVMLGISIWLGIYSKKQETLAERLLFEESAAARDAGFDAVKKLESRVNWANSRAKLAAIPAVILGMISLFMLYWIGTH